MQFEERVGRGAIICPMQRLEYLPPTREMINQKGREENKSQTNGWMGRGERGERTEMMSASRTTASVSASAMTIFNLSGVT